eukprot:scaffold94541_cov69-Phaeocystis_antarctica.AAC.2
MRLCRVDSSTSGGAAESTSSICVQRSGGASMCAQLSQPNTTASSVEAQGRPGCNSRSVAAFRSVAALVAVFTRSGSPVRIKARDTSTIRENRVQPRLRLTSSRLRLTSNIWFTASENSILSNDEGVSLTTPFREHTHSSKACPIGHAPSALPGRPHSHDLTAPVHHLMHARHARRLSGTRPSSPSPPSTSSLAERSATHC